MVYTAAGPHTPGLLSGSRYAALASVSSSSSPPSTTTCTFCSKPGHVELACELYLAAQSAAREQTKKQCKKRRRKRTKAKVAASPIADMVKEFAGNSIITPSPGTNSELWNCDTGATSHMTPHRHWFKTYTPYVTPISLANGQIVYSAGIGSIQFEPVIKGRRPESLSLNMCCMFLISNPISWLSSISPPRKAGMSISPLRECHLVCMGMSFSQQLLTKRIVPSWMEPLLSPLTLLHLSALVLWI